MKSLKIEAGSGITNKKLDRPLRIAFGYEGASLDTLAGALGQRADAEIADLVCVLDRGVVLAPNMLISWSTDSPYGIFKSKSAALGFLYYYLVTYGNGFLARSVPLGSYFTPFGAWEDPA